MPGITNLRFIFIICSTTTRLRPRCGLICFNFLHWFTHKSIKGSNITKPKIIDSHLPTNTDFCHHLDPNRSSNYNRSNRLLWNRVNTELSDSIWSETIKLKQQKWVNKILFYANFKAFLSLKVEKLVIQFHTGLSVDALTHKESQLVGVLAGSGHSDDPLKHKEKQSDMTNIMSKVSDIHTVGEKYLIPCWIYTFAHLHRNEQ